MKEECSQVIEWWAFWIAVAAFVVSVLGLYLQHISINAGIRQTFLAHRLERLMDIVLKARGLRDLIVSSAQLEPPPLDLLMNCAEQAEEVQRGLHCLGVIEEEIEGLETLWREVRAAEPHDPRQGIIMPTDAYSRVYEKFERALRKQCRGDRTIKGLLASKWQRWRERS